MKNGKFLVLILAVADAVRTSLGPRGMDKMVGILFYGALFWAINFDVVFGASIALHVLRR